MKIKKQVQKKRFNFNRNRKRLNKQRASTGKIKCRGIKDYWNENITVASNSRQMGLSSDPNKTLGIPNSRENRLKLKKIINGIVDEIVEDKPFVPRKGFVADALEEEAKAPRESQLRLPKGHIAELIYFMDKYRLNYPKMVTDRRNHYQYTWKQFRAKIRKFISITEQFHEYLHSKNIQPADFNWIEYSGNEDEN